MDKPVKNNKKSFFSLRKNLIRLMASKQIDALRLAEKTDIPVHTINRLRSKNIGNPTLKLLLSLAKFFGLTISQLIGETSTAGNMVPVVPLDKITNVLKEGDHDTTHYPSIVTDMPITQGTATIIMSGSSMEPFLSDKSLLIIDPKTEPKNKDFVLAVSKDQQKPIVRQILFDGDDAFLKILNSQFSREFKITPAKNYTILGTIIQSRNDYVGQYALDIRTTTDEKIAAENYG